MSDQSFLQDLVKSQDSFDFVLDVDGKEFVLFDVNIEKFQTPVRRPTTRGGVYFSDTSAYKIRCSVLGNDIVPLLSCKMLGPSTDFEELGIKITQKNSVYGKLYGILTNSVQAKNQTSLGMIIVRTENL